MDYYTLWVHQIKTPITLGPRCLRHLLSSSRWSRSFSRWLLCQSGSAVPAIGEFSWRSGLKARVARGLGRSGPQICPLFIQENLTVNLHDFGCRRRTDLKWLLKVIIRQLLVNSLKYTSTGGVRSISRSDPLYKRQQVGIKITMSSRVFEQGFSSYNGHDPAILRSGLYLSKKIAEQLGLGSPSSEVVKADRYIHWRWEVGHGLRFPILQKM